ncbi:Putative glycosyltransferase EpsE [uncultured bacterium]|nr:Putative glycosyltransferase EpsE [uncultured bacterium]
MDAQPRVGIGLPVYNGQKYIEETVVSILNQTYSDFELIICDNASTDQTQAICQSYMAKDKRIRYYRNAKNLGVALNYNRVFELSAGDYFKWADYDDLLAPDFLSKTIQVLNQNPLVAVCFPRVKLIDEHGKFIGNYDPLPDTSSPKAGERFRNLILDPRRAVQAMGLMRSVVIKKTHLHGKYPSSDEVFMAEMALLGRFCEIPDRVLSVRIHPEQSTQGALASQRKRVLFFDPSAEGKTVLLKWLYFEGCLTAIQNAPLTLGERLYCYLQMIRWLLIWKNFKSMTKDLLLGARELVRSVVRPGAKAG